MPIDRDRDGLVDGTSGYVPALLLPPTAIAIALAAVPLFILDCITRLLTGTYRDTRDGCPDVALARTADLGTSVASAPRDINDVDIFVDVRPEGDVYFVVPKVPVQRPLATIAILLLVVALAVALYQLGRERGRGEGTPG